MSEILIKRFNFTQNLKNMCPLTVIQLKNHFKVRVSDHLLKFGIISLLIRFSCEILKVLIRVVASD